MLAQTKRRFVQLDMLRGLAALIVVIGHIRGCVLVEHGQSATASWFDKAIYLAGGLGHQAVIAFFALSGFLVGGAALAAMLSGTWSWRKYLTARLSRLWTVVIPALALTWMVDRLGLAFGATGYDGRYYTLIWSGPSSHMPADHSIATLIANLLFLQTIAAPVFGSNGPLWSLANEFWYYILFPMAASAFLVRRPLGWRVLAGLIPAVLAWWLPRELMLLGLIWVAGAVACFLTARLGARGTFSHPLYVATSGGVLAALILLSKVYSGIGIELLQGLAWAAFLPTLTVLPSPHGAFGRVAAWLSEISYTLYATHFPLLIFIYFVFLAPRKWSPGMEAFWLFATMLTCVLLGAFLMWWCFERNTNRVRRSVDKAFSIAAGH